MPLPILGTRRLGSALLIVVLATTGLVLTGRARAAEAAPTATRKWDREIPGAVVRGSSPLAVDLDGGGQDVVFGSYNGNVYALHGSDGSFVGGWPQNTGYQVWSSPSAADVDGGGPEVFVGTGLADRALPPGHFFSFAANGATRWRFTGTDTDNPQQAVQASGAIADVNTDGTPDVVFGTIGHTMHNLTATTGSQNGGWPVQNDDSSFSTPALADLNGDGQTDIIVGHDASPGGYIDHKGGLLRAVTGTGTELWRRYFNDIVYSSPAVGDLDGDGRLEIAVGNGDYWQRVEPGGGHSDSTRFFLLNADGSTRWSKDTGYITTGSPALADVNGDGRRDIVLGTWSANSGRIFAWDVNGTQLLNQDSPDRGAVLGSITTADVNADGAQDLLVPTGAGVYVINGRNGSRLLDLGPIGEIAYQNSPLATDVDGNGVLDIIIAGTRASNNAGFVQRYEISGGVLGARGWHTFHGDARRTGSLTNPTLNQSFCGPSGSGGYWMVARDGGIFAFCDAQFRGSMGGKPLNAPIVGMASTKDGSGYWMVASDGGIFAFNAPFYGSMGGQPLNQPIVGIARTPSGNGYWMVAADGGIFAFGDAPFFGSMGGKPLNKPIVAIAAHPGGNGYWMVASDGGIFAFGAPFHGSMGGKPLNQPIVGMTPNGDGSGYWMVASDGGIFAFNVPFRGSMGGQRLNQPIVGMSRNPEGNGYRLVASDGGIFSFGAPFFGSTGHLRLNQPVVGMAVPAL
jgi:hypothetical protein